MEKGIWDDVAFALLFSCTQRYKKINIFLWFFLDKIYIYGCVLSGVMVVFIIQ